jgi:hypothetical protein
MKANYWTKFWKNYATNIKDEDPQTQVLRTMNRKPISQNNGKGE